MRVIFLDFDGVLNNATTGQLGERSGFESQTVEWWAAGLDRGCVENLNAIVRATGAVVVVSSAWRLNGTIDWLQSVLDVAGFEGRVVGKTRSARGGEQRGDQIADWLEIGRTLYGIEVEAFVILDDDNDMGPLEPLLVQTSMKTGLMFAHAARAIDLLLTGPGR